jgi:hypothetical protein
MSAAITQLKQTIYSPTMPELAMVTAVNDLGQIIQVNIIDSNENQAITAQAKHLSKAKQGDTVVIQNTRQGLIVTCLLALNTDAPAAYIVDENGHIHIKGEQGIHLTTDKGSFVVRGNGNISLEGQAVQLSGWPLSLN